MRPVPEGTGLTMDDEATESSTSVLLLSDADLQIHEEFGLPLHEEFVDHAAAPPRAPSHRKGMLGGLAAVGALLAILVVVAPGGSTPKLPAQVIRDVSPARVASSKTPAAPASPTTTPNATGTTTAGTEPASGVSQGATVMEASDAGASSTRATVTAAGHRSSTPAPTSATPPASTPTSTSTAPASTATTTPTTTPTTTSTPPTTTPTTTPPPTTTTTSCVLGILCNGP
jgi:hypothetical protein